MSDNPFAKLTRKQRARTRINRWRDGLLRPLRPSHLAPDRAGPPNLLLIGVDTLRADHLGLSGYGQPTSPHLDRLAASGTIFSDVTAPAPWTLPSFTSALTGLMPGLHGAFLPGSSRNMDTQAPRRLNEGIVTLAKHLRDNGFRTAAFYSNPFFAFGLAESFEHHTYLNLPAAEVARQAREWLRRNADRPCFCFVLFNDPHEPTTPDAVDLAPFLPRLSAQGVPTDGKTIAAYSRWGDRPGVDLTQTTWPLSPEADQARQIKLAIYDATIRYVDRVIGSLQESLEVWDLARNTLVSVFSDHGEEFLDHTEWAHRWGHDPRGICGIGHGHAHFEEVLRVPWVSWGPGVPGGQRFRHPVSLLDLTPTLLSWLGLPALAGLPLADDFRRHLVGRDQNNESGRAGDRLILSEAIAYGPDLVALRQGDLKLIAHRDGRPLALFDLKTDPRETRDRRQDLPAEVDALLLLLNEWRSCGGGDDAEQGESWAGTDEEIKRRLKDLGYTD